MANQMTISPEEVLSIAGQLKSLNTQLEDILTTSQAQVSGLQGSWTGTAADATIGAFNSFASKYFDNYKQLIDAYAKFLEQNVAAGYQSVTKANLGLADMI